MPFQRHPRDQRHHKRSAHRGLALSAVLVALIAGAGAWITTSGAGSSAANAGTTAGATPGPGGSSSSDTPGAPSNTPGHTPSTPPAATTPAGSATTKAAASGPGQPLGPAGAWTTEFDDEFSGGGINPGTWATTSVAEPDGGHGNLNNFQLEWDQGQNCSVNGGVLTITAQRTSYTSAEGNHYGWTSCLLSSKPSFAFHYGFMEMRAKLPAAAGFWPGFWTWQTAGPDNETDAMEYYSNDRYHVSLFQHSDGRGGCAYQVLPFNATTAFHTYGADIEPTGTTWYLDGQKVCSTNSTSTGMTNVMVTMFVYSKSQPAAGTDSAAEQIDYVRVWGQG